MQVSGIVKAKAAFNGRMVAERAEMSTHWRGVTMIMDRVREQCGGDDESAEND